MKFELSRLLEENLPVIQKIKTKAELEKYVKNIIVRNNLTKNKTSAIILKQLGKSSSLQESQQYVWNVIVSSSGAFIGKEKTKKSWYKGTAIHGLECHSFR